MKEINLEFQKKLTMLFCVLTGVSFTSVFPGLWLFELYAVPLKLTE